MSHRSESSVLVVTVRLILLLVFVAGGVWLYFIYRNLSLHTTVAIDQAYEAEMQARAEADEARAEAARAVAAGASAGDQESSPGRDDSIRAAVESILRIQEEAWNRGDIDAFMEHYWRSDDLTFSSGGKTTRGWTATLDRYKERYPTREQMGRTTFSGLEITLLGSSAAMVLGQWKLDREREPVSGNFSLVVRKMDGCWVIVHDPTSRLME
jgi:beta-aspartyl-peptidase (threonine type)